MIQFARPLPSEPSEAAPGQPSVPGLPSAAAPSAASVALGGGPVADPAAAPHATSGSEVSCSERLESVSVAASGTVVGRKPSVALPSTAVTPRQRGIEVLGEEIARLSAHIQAATGRLLDLIRTFEASEGWHHEGFKSCAQWLSWRTGIAPGAAREKVRVARALGELPELRAALGAGELSYSVARALTRVATAENEAELVEVARYSTAADLERLVRAWQVADRSEADEGERHAARYLWLIPDADGSWMVRGRLDPEVGAVLSRALEAASETLYRAESTYRAESAEAARPPMDSAEMRRADAIGLVAEAALGCDFGAGPEPAVGRSTGDPSGGAESATGCAERAERSPVVGRAERFQVVVHVSAETLGSEDAVPRIDGGIANSEGGAGRSNGDATRIDANQAMRIDDNRMPRVDNSEVARIEREVGRIERGPHVSAETLRRLACDAGLVTMTHDRDGNVLDVGRRRRTVPAAIRRALDVRDRRCRFPGCTTRHCDAHHVKHWAQGGETTLDNLVLLCRHHHRRVHEGGWSVTLSKTGEVGFHRPDGALLPRVPECIAVPEEPAYELKRYNDQGGVEIDAWTATPLWTGDRMDVDWALFTLGRPAPTPVSAET